MILDKQAILSAKRLAKKEVVVEDLGGSVLVRELTAKEASELVQKHKAGIDDVLVMAWVVCKTAIKDDGSRLFSDSDADAVADLSLKTLKQLSQASLELSGMLGAEEQKKTS